MKTIINGIIEYCYNGLPIIRGYAPAKTLIKYSVPHHAYQRKTDDLHTKEIIEYVSGAGIKFMPEIILSYNYSGINGSDETNHSAEWHDPVHRIIVENDLTSFEDCGKGLSLQGMRRKNGIKPVKIIIDPKSPFFSNNNIFHRIDGNHRLEALDSEEKKDVVIPFCIIMLNDFGYIDSNQLEKEEMEVFHNINSKVQPLTSTEQYKGLFNLFSVDELNKYGKEFSLTKAYLAKHKNLRFNNIKSFFTDIEDIVLFCIQFLFEHGNEINEDDLADIFSTLEYTYFADNEIIRMCKNRFAIVPYVYYCYVGEKHKNSKLDAYNSWFIKNRLYNIKDFDPASIIETFDSIYEIRKKQIFVAMPFKPELDFVYKAICDTVDKINKENGIDLLKPIRIDKKIVGFSYDIVKEILENIKNAGLLIADLSEQNANVYYEAGYAIGLLESCVGNTAKVLYLISNPDEPDNPFGGAKFDVTHYKMIPYKNAGNGVDELKDSLEKELKVFYCI